MKKKKLTQSEWKKVCKSQGKVFDKNILGPDKCRISINEEKNQCKKRGMTYDKEITGSDKCYKSEKDLENDCKKVGKKYDNNSGKCIVKSAAGGKAEKEFFENLKEYKNQTLTKDESDFLLQKLGLDNIKELSTISDVTQPKNTSKSDVIMTIANKQFGISYKKESYRTVQSWTKNEKWLEIFGETKFRKIVNKVNEITQKRLKDTKDNKLKDKLFLGTSINIGIAKDKTKIDKNSFLLSDIIHVSRDNVHDILFGTNLDSSECQFMIEKTNTKFTNITEFINELVGKEESINRKIDKLRVDVRFVFLNNSSSNNGTNLMVSWVFDPDSPIKTIICNNDTINSGKYMTLFDNPIQQKCKNLNTNHLVNYYEHHFDIKFPDKKLKWSKKEGVGEYQPEGPKECRHLINNTKNKSQTTKKKEEK